ncbi:DMT family transporter [Candidatus Peregrinibacteria bacterium]|nr:DMT family transporter [Candidatus Peregrinibacteria bacterium]
MFSSLSKTRQGELYEILALVIWSFFPVVTILTLNSVPPLFTAALSILSAAIFFAVLITLRKEWSDIKNKSVWLDILLTTLFIGIIYYGLTFIGINNTTAGNASIISLSQVFFSMLFLRLWGKELLNSSHVIGAVLIVLGAFAILFQGTLEVNIGNLLILIATLFTPIGNYFQQKARKQVSSIFIMFFRSLISGLVLLALAFVYNIPPSIFELKDSIIFILMNGFFLLGLSKIFFIEAIHRIPITKALALGAIGPAITLVIAFFVLNEVPTIWQLVGFLPMLIGVLLLTDMRISFNKFRHNNDKYLINN